MAGYVWKSHNCKGKAAHTGSQSSAACRQPSNATNQSAHTQTRSQVSVYSGCAAIHSHMHVESSSSSPDVRTRSKYGRRKAKAGGHATNATLAALKTKAHRKAGAKPEHKNRLAVRRTGSKIICAAQQSNTPCNHLQQRNNQKIAKPSLVDPQTSHESIGAHIAFEKGRQRSACFGRTLPASRQTGTLSSCTRAEP